MKYFSIIAFLLTYCIAFSQEYYVPYRINNKYGLANKKGKLVINTQYDDLDYLDKDYFVAKTYAVIDPKEKWTSNIKPVKTTLIKGKKVFIADTEYENFLFAENFIINSKNPYRPEQCDLYNLKGEALLRNVKNLYINDGRDIKHLDYESAKYDFISTIERNSYGQTMFSLALYDTEGQTIEKWLVKDVSKYEVTGYGKGFIEVSFIDDRRSMQHKRIEYSNSTFNITDAQMSTTGEVYGDIGYMGHGSYDIEASDYPIAIEAAPKAKEYTEEELETRDLLYYTVKNDSLYYVRNTEKKFIAISDPAKHAYAATNPKFIRQKEALIVKKNNRHSLLVKGIESIVVYDSIYYLGDNFIAGNRVGSTMKFGMLNKRGEEILPVTYDSIKGAIMKFSFAEQGDKRVVKFTHEGPDKYSRVPVNPYVKKATAYIQLYKEGKTGLVSPKMEVIIPLEYDLIAKNDLNFMSKKSDYILLKKNNKYGATFMGYDSESQRFEMNNTITPVFNDLPCFYILNYYGIKGFKLWGMYGSDAVYKGYASPQGAMYYRDK